MPSIQLDKILEDISKEKSLYKLEDKTKKCEEEAWKRVASNNSITLHEVKAIYNVLIRKYNTEKAKSNSTWKMYETMKSIQESRFVKDEKDDSTKECDEGMIELMEVFEEDDESANDQELDKSNGSTASKTSGVSTRSSGSNSTKNSPENQKKVLNSQINMNVSNAISTSSLKSSTPNTQKVVNKPNIIKKDNHPVKRKLEHSSTPAPVVKKATIQATPPLKPKQQMPASVKPISKPVEVAAVAVPTPSVKEDLVQNGFTDSQEEDTVQKQNAKEMKMPDNFFKYLCSSRRYESFGLYIANYLNRLDDKAARKLESQLLRTITDFDE